MKIGIVTFWYSHENYGQLLQAYALSTYLKEEGHDVFLVKYDKNKAVKNESRNKSLFDKLSNLSFSKIQKKFNKVLSSETKVKSPDRQFNNFRNDFLTFSDSTYDSYNDLQNSPPEADVYIVGSDQVWNYVFIGAFEPYFLKFGKQDIKRISYAASIGHRELPDEVQARYTELLKNFTAISVRELSGVELVKKMGFSDAKLMPDPTFLLSPEAWAPLINTVAPIVKDGKRNIFIYTLGNRPLEAKEQLISYVNGLVESKVYHASINNDPSGNLFPTIPEWLNHINSSDIVITNSFHGVVFSIIFNKKFIALPSKGATVGMNERMESLLQKLHLSEYILYSFNQNRVDEIIRTDVDWTLTNSTLATWLVEAEDFLNF